MALNLFRALPIADTVYQDELLPTDTKDYVRDQITLGWEARLKARGRRTSDGGAEFATALPRGTVLREGDVLLVAALRMHVRVVEALESVFVVRPTTADEAARFAYQIGNSHQPLMLADGLLICPDVLGMAQVLDHHGIAYERTKRAFTPVSQVTNHQHAVVR
ncbi:MAG: hypothetical protein ABL961_02155 [Vicinamibacterales bacterium]